MSDKIKVDPRTKIKTEKVPGKEKKSPYDPKKIIREHINKKKELKTGGSATHGYGKAYLKGGRVK